MSEGTMDPAHPGLPTTRAEIERHLCEGLAKALGLATESIVTTKAFTAFGLDSIKAFALTGDLAEWLDHDLPATLFWDHPNIEALTTYVADVLDIEQ